MASLKVSLLGKFSMGWGGKGEYKIESRKVQELFVYLLVFRNHPQPRESLCDVLWADQSATKSRKNLRQTLWHIQYVFRQIKNLPRPDLSIGNGWVQIILPAGFWLDTAEFEHVFDLINLGQVQQLSEAGGRP